MSLHRVLRAIRPAEWVLLAFLSFLIVKLAAAPHVQTDDPTGRASVVLGLAIVLCARMQGAYRRTPWSEGVSIGWRRIHGLLGTAALFAPIYPVYVLGGFDWSGFTGNAGDHLAMISTVSFGILVYAAEICVPGVIVWLGLGLHLKKHSRFAAAALVQEATVEGFRQLRDWIPLMLLIVAYRWMGLVLNRNDGTIADRDAILARIDRLLCFGHDPVATLQHLGGLPLLEWATFCYAGYFILYPLCLGAVFALDREEPFRELALALALALAVGYVGYSIVPAQGPAYASHLIPPLDHMYFRAMRAAVIDPLKIRRDCMPSLHTCTSLLLFWGCWRHRRRLAWCIAPVVVTIPFACVYLGFHYLIDVIVGAALAGVITVLAPRWSASMETREARAPLA